jgi:putative NIF3 family GTP cyclohydrolase 1 type 2
MKGPEISRRAFTIALAGVAGGKIPFARGADLTASDVIARIQSAAGVPMPENGPDGFKAGDASVEVKGIATTAMATLDVLKQASKKGLNLVITYEGVYYGQQGSGRGAGPGGRGPGEGPGGGAGQGAGVRGGQGPGGGRGPAGLGPDDPVYMAKREFIEKNGMAVYCFRGQWAGRKENPLATGLAEMLGWTKYQTAGDPTSYQMPAVILESLVADIRKRLNTRAGIRVVGSREASIRKVALFPGLISIDTGLKRLPEADLLLTGEAREWEVVEYAFDTVTAGGKKGFIMLGRIASEDPGMRACSDWVKSVVTEVPVRWIGIGDPYWRPAR